MPSPKMSPETERDASSLVLVGRQLPPGGGIARVFDSDAHAPPQRDRGRAQGHRISGAACHHQSRSTPRERRSCSAICWRSAGSPAAGSDPAGADASACRQAARHSGTSSARVSGRPGQRSRTETNEARGALPGAGASCPRTEPTRVTRIRERQSSDPLALDALLDEAPIAHIAVVRSGAAVVLPILFVRDGNSLFLHGSSGGGLLREAAGKALLTVTATLTDALAVARSTFDTSMNYRSAMILGTAVAVEDDEKARARPARRTPPARP